MKKQLPTFTTRSAEIPQLLDKAIRAAIKPILRRAKSAKVGMNVSAIHFFLEEQGLTIYTQTIKTTRGKTAYVKKVTKEILVSDVMAILESMTRHGSIKRNLFWSI